MASTQLRVDGLTELRAALKALPEQLRTEAGTIVHAQAEAAAREIVAQYPIKTGALRRGVSVELRGDPVSVGAVVKSRARHAHLFDTGTGPRRWANGKSTGTMPAGKVFVPIAIQRRRIMLAALIDLVERAGLRVTGTPALSLRS